MILPSIEKRHLVTELLRQKPFECNRVFFFSLVDELPNPLDEESAKLYQRDKDIVDMLPRCDIREDWSGNIVEGPRENALAYFYASYRFDHVMIVVSKIIDVLPGKAYVESPFNKYFIDAIAASLADILGPTTFGKVVPANRKVLPAKRTTPFNELAAWRECKHLWRKKLGADVWIAIKGKQPIAVAKTVEELDQKINALQVEPPLLYAPPEGQEKIADIISMTNKKR